MESGRIHLIRLLPCLQMMEVADNDEHSRLLITVVKILYIIQHKAPGAIEILVSIASYDLYARSVQRPVC